MRYTSTRDATKFYTFEEALFSGYAKDGGLFVPEKLPQVNSTTLKEWSKLGYVDLSTEVLHPFIGQDQISKLELKSLLERALLNGNVFDTTDDNLVPVVPIVKRRRRTTTSNDHDDHDICRCYVAELFHGPTYCFKDLGMRATIFLLDYFATKKNNDTANKNKSIDKKVVLLASTTGDTGPAAVQAVQDLNSPNLSIVIHYPYGQISDFQRKQMTTVQSSRVKIVSFDGGGDDLDRPIKRIMTSTTTKTRTKMATTDNGIDDDDSNNTIICGVNSYNIGRPLMQMVHFIWTYLRVKEQHIKNEIEIEIENENENETKQKEDNFRLDIVIPTGAMGNIAGCVSKVLLIRI